MLRAKAPWQRFLSFSLQLASVATLFAAEAAALAVDSRHRDTLNLQQRVTQIHTGYSLTGKHGSRKRSAFLQADPPSAEGAPANASESLDVEDGAGHLLGILLNTTEEAEIGCEEIHNMSAQQYVLLGPQDSGTNLLHEMMHETWPSEVCLAKNKIWKHVATGSEDIYAHLAQTIGAENMQNLVVLHTVRSPISQAVSWSKAFYELGPCVQRPFANWTQPCAAPMGPNMQNISIAYENTMAVYNTYLKEYDDLHRQQGRFKAVVAVPYEDLLLTPNSALAFIAEHFDHLRLPDKAKMFNKPAKQHGDPVGHAAAVQKLLSRSYLKALTPEAIGIVCQGLDVNLAAQWSEGTFLEEHERVSYLSDCQQAGKLPSTEPVAKSW